MNLINLTRFPNQYQPCQVKTETEIWKYGVFDWRLEIDNWRLRLKI